MKSFTVEDDLVEMVWKRANPKPFENLSFSEALRRILGTTQVEKELIEKKTRLSTPEEMLAELNAMSEEELEALKQKVKKVSAKRAPSPSPEAWVSSVPELHSISGLRKWKDICNHFGIDTGGDSPRRKLKNWVKSEHPGWPDVPDVECSE
jgi:hypothetical protein